MAREVDALVTGATGFIGRWLLTELTADGEHVAVLLRGDRGRIAGLRSWVEAHGGQGERVHPLAGDLAAAGLGLGSEDTELARTARRVFHLGAAMSFGLPPAVARTVNVEGSVRMAELAASLPRLERLVMVTGFQHRRAPSWMSASYHDSKLDADAAVRTVVAERSLPATTVHPAMVVGDSRTGETTQLWGWADLVRAVERRRLPVLPGGPRHWMPLVAVDHLARFLVAASVAEEAVGGDYWVLHDETPPLRELVGIVADTLSVPAPRLGLPVPLVALGLRAGLSRWAGLDPEALVFLGTDRFPTEGARALAASAGLVEPDPEALTRTTTAYLRDTRATRPGRAGGFIEARVGARRGAWPRWGGRR